MSENLITEDDGDDDIVVIEGDPPVEDEQSEAEYADEEEDSGDERLGDSEDDSEDEVVNRNRIKRQKRQAVRQRAKERADAELMLLREQNDALLRRVSAIEGNTLANNVSAIDQRFNQVQNEVKQAEMIIARAVEAGNGEDVAAAMRLRDEAQREAAQLWQTKQQVEQVRQQHANPGPDQRVVNYAKEWMQANPWYDPAGRDEDSAITKAIDNQLAAAGYDPKSSDYWHELTRRVAARIGDDSPSAPAKRKAPPTGTTREHAPVSTKKEIYVTPERKQAMIEAGIWDDVPRRNQMLKAYQAYDKSSAN